MNIRYRAANLEILIARYQQSFGTRLERAELYVLVDMLLRERNEQQQTLKQLQDRVQTLIAFLESF